MLDESIIRLVPFNGHVACVGTENRFLALEKNPWLLISSAEKFAGKLVELRYSQSLVDPLSRPKLRFDLANGNSVFELLPAPYLGTGIWIGRIPLRTCRIMICPAVDCGQFSFRIDKLALIRWREFLHKSRYSRKHASYAVAANIIGRRDEASKNLRWVLGSTPITDFHKWAVDRRRNSILVTNCDEMIDVFIHGDDEYAIAQTCESLNNQTHLSWRAFRWRSKSATAEPCLRGAGSHAQDADYYAHVMAGDRFSEEALACFLAHFSRHPDQNAAYADDLTELLDGTILPRFKPDWSPVRQDFAPYVGRAVLLRRASALAALPQESADEYVFRNLRELKFNEIGHVARALLTSHYPADNASPRPRTVPPLTAHIGIVIPTRNKVGLLRECIESILNLSTHPDFEIVIVDNGTERGRAWEALLRVAAVDTRIRVIERPGKFNFSALCNLGASNVAGQYLLFLNNDTQVLTSDWLERLGSFASLPDVGAVGARLIYPHGTIQHSGVVLGIGGVAAHFERGLKPDEQGWLNGNIVPHECSAVTAACLMIERRKFDAVGGFDETNLPVDLNDVDLCLRLAARGWRSICDAQTDLIHYESASRGRSLWGSRRKYAAERAYFIETWRDAIRNDPYFNPGMSLFSFRPALG